MVEDRTNWQWIPNLQLTLDKIHVTERKPDKSRLTVKNIGMHGLKNAPLVKLYNHF